jgi:integrase
LIINDLQISAGKSRLWKSFFAFCAEVESGTSESKEQRFNWPMQFSFEPLEVNRRTTNGGVRGELIILAARLALDRCRSNGPHTNRKEGWRGHTAILELKTLAMTMGEAIRLGHAEANPLVSIKLRRDKAEKKPELTDNEIVDIRTALGPEPQWMQRAFEIALHTGCRLRETRIPRECIDLAENKITFPFPKGGEDRAFSVPMPSALRPLLEEFGRGKEKFTVDLPFQPSRRWQQFFIKIKKPHLCFYCLRVTYVNRLRRAGVPREAAMRLVNHASELIHGVYQREKVEDVAQWRDAVSFPAVGV